MDYKLKFCYQPPTKLCEGNVFSRVCQSVHKGRHVTITHDVIGQSEGPPPALTSSLYRHPMAPSPFRNPPTMFKLVHYAVRTVGKQAVYIRPKCLLVLHPFYFPNRKRQLTFHGMNVPNPQSFSSLQNKCLIPETSMHSSRMRTGRSLTVCQSLLLGGGGWIWSPSISPLGVGLDLIPLNFPLGCGPGPDPPQFPLGCGPGSDPPQFPPWVWAWIWSPSISPLGVGLDLIPLNFPLGCGPGSDPPQFPLGCGPGSDPPQFPPWVWAWIWSPSISPLGVGLDLIPLNFPLGCEPGGGSPGQGGASFLGGLLGRGVLLLWGGAPFLGSPSWGVSSGGFSFLGGLLQGVGGASSWGVSLAGGFSLGGCLLLEADPPVDRITDTSKNITLATTSLQPVIMPNLCIINKGAVKYAQWDCISRDANWEYEYT